MTYRKRIVVRETFLGCHNWPNADATSQGVDFLLNKHAHDFVVSVRCNVFDFGRDIEFYVLRRRLKEVFANRFQQVDGFYQFGDLSCEAIAQAVLECLTEEYEDGERCWSVTVMENNHQGATVFWSARENEEHLPTDLSIESYDELVSEARSIFEGRKASYGNSIGEIDVHTIVGLMRMKLFRIYEQGADAKTRDELLDTINYAVFALARLTSEN